MFLEKALWRTFLFVIFSSLLSAAIMLFFKWQDIKNENFTKLEYTNSIIQKSMDAVLKHQQTVLTLSGKRLLDLFSKHQQTNSKKLINEMLAQNPDIAGFGLADIDGNLILTSTNLESGNLPNLLTKPETAISFRKSLQTDNMVLGRTYYMIAADKWLIPARFRITDDQKRPIAVMTTGFIYNAENSPWNDKKLPESVGLLIVKKEGDHYYRQYMSHIEPKDYDFWLNSPIPTDVVQEFEANLKQQNKISINTLKNLPAIFRTEAKNRFGENMLSTIQYDKEYDLFTITTLKINSIYKELVPSIIWLAILLVAFNSALFYLFRVIQKIQIKSKAKLQFQAIHDALTQLPNRHFFNNLCREWKNLKHQTASLLFVDLNNFKSANDFYGHKIGDALLIEVANRLKKNFVQDRVIRLGGDEFIILLTDESEDNAHIKSSEFLAQLKQPIKIDDIEFHINATIGISHYPQDGESLDELLRKADIAMYEAKRLKQSYLIFSASLDEKRKRQSLIEKELQNALDNNEFSLVYQPQIDSKTSKISGIESLVRWKNQLLGDVSPAEFIPIAEASGNIYDIGKFVLHQSLLETREICTQLSDTEKKQLFKNDVIRLSVNISVQQLFHHDFSSCLITAFKDHRLPDLSLMIEITESLFIEDTDKAISLLESFRDIGVKISLDDFGTGYSSLSILSVLPIDELKIDRSFVNNMISNTHSSMLIQSIITIGKKLDIPVIAEGVETKAQAELLSSYNCNTLQGYLFSQPLEKQKLLSFLRSYHT